MYFVNLGSVEYLIFTLLNYLQIEIDIIFNFKCFTDLICKPNFNRENSVLTLFIIVE